MAAGVLVGAASVSGAELLTVEMGVPVGKVC
jgi:hypothetical protein